MANSTFTKRFLESLRPTVKRYYRLDSRVPGLGITVYPSGTKTFFFRKKKGHIDTGRIPLGNWLDGRIPDMTIDQAKKVAIEYNSQVNDGINPSAEKRATRDELTFGQLYRVYLEDHAKVHKKTWNNDECQYKKYLKKWENYPLSSIRPDMVAALFGSIVAAGKPAMANRVLAQVSVMFRLAGDWGYFQGLNPGSKIKKKKIPNRIRKIQKHEFPAFSRPSPPTPSKHPGT